MPITLNHLLVPARDRDASAGFFAEVLGLEVGERSPGSPPGRFAVVRVGETNFDFDNADTFDTHHYAFLVSDEEFDAILQRIRSKGIAFSADPLHTKVGEINHNEGGRGFYFHDLDGHNLELLTRT